MNVQNYGDLRLFYPYMTEESRGRVLSALKNVKKPCAICGHAVPATLNLITFGQLADLQKAASQPDGALAALQALWPDITTSQLDAANVYVVTGFLRWVGKECERINALWEEIKVRHTAEERAAGAESLNFGTFGVLDWYAHRQGIADQNEVRDIKWVRIYTCMRQDNERREYERRLNEQMRRSIKAKTKF